MRSVESQVSVVDFHQVEVSCVHVNEVGVNEGLSNVLGKPREVEHGLGWLEEQFSKVIFGYLDPVRHIIHLDNEDVTSIEGVIQIEALDGKMNVVPVHHSVANDEVGRVDDPRCHFLPLEASLEVLINVLELE